MNKAFLAGTAVLTILTGWQAGTASADDDSGTMARANPEMRAVLSKLDELKPAPLGTVPPAEARKQPTPADAVAALLKSQGKDPQALKQQMGATTQDLTYKGADGSDIPARVYKPANAGSGALPLVLYIHGGGWVIADIETYDASPRALAKKANVIIVSVHYRQAPEAKFPASHDDVVAAYKWALENAASWGADPKRVAILGESAGGNMAITTALAARDQKLPAPAGIVAVYPVAGTDMTTPSYKENEKAKPLNKMGMEWFFQQETASDADKKDPRLDLVKATILKGLPPVAIITDDIDPLMSEGEMLAANLKKQGVSVTSKNYAGVTHEFFGMGAVIKEADDAENFAAASLDKFLGVKSP